MESGEGLTNAILQARVSAAKRDAWGWEGEFHKARAEQKESAAIGWYWRAIFRALKAVFWEFAKRHPDDPLCKPTGRKRPDGSPELEYHRLFDQNLEKEIKEMPSDVSRGPALRQLLQKVKL